MAHPELPDDRRAQTGRHSRGDQSRDPRGEGPAGPPGPAAPRIPILPATSWPIDGPPSGARPIDAGLTNGHTSNGHTFGGDAGNGYGTNGYGTNGYGTNGYGTNGYGTNGYGASGSGANGSGMDGHGTNGHSVDEYDRDAYGRAAHDGNPDDGNPDGRDRYDRDPYGRDPYDRDLHDRDRYDQDRDRYEREDAHLPTPPYGWSPDPFAADGPSSDGPGGRHSTSSTPGALVARSEAPGDGWTTGDPASTTPNGRPLIVGDGPLDPPRSAPPAGPGRRFHSDVPPRRKARPTDDVPAPGLSAEYTSAPGRSRPDTSRSSRARLPRPAAQVWPAPVRSGDREPPLEHGRELAEAADPPTVVFDADVEDLVDDPDRRPDHHPELVDAYSDDIADDGSPDFPGKHRRRAGEPAEERSRSTRRGRPRGAREGRGGRRRRSSFWKELPVLIVVALVLTFLIQTFLAKVYVIPSGSMETTLHGCPGCNNDRVLVDKVSYRFADPEPGDVVVFRGPDGWTSEFTPDAPANVGVRALQSLGSLIGLAPPDEKDFIKRIIAVGGQTVKCCDSHNRILVNDKPLDEPYLYFLPDAGSARQDSFGPITVPAGQLWVMGDSRNNSADSRVHGPIPIANVIGRARLVVLPFARFGTIPSPDPQTTTVGMGADGGGPAALGAVVLLWPALLRRRTHAAEEFLPRRRT